MAKIFMTIDGDDVGHQLEYYMLTNNAKELQAFSKKFDLTLQWLKNELIDKFSAKIYFCGGDNLLVEIEENHFSINKIEEIREVFQKKANNSLSIGLGSTIRQAYFSLKLAKSSGKNKICNYMDFSNG